METITLDRKAMYTMAINPLTGKLDMVPELGWFSRNMTSVAEQAAAINVVTDPDNDTVTLEEDTLFVFTEELEFLTINNLEVWGDSSMAHIKFQSGEVATTVVIEYNEEFYEEFVITGSVEANSLVELSILGHTAILTSVPNSVPNE